VLRSRVQRSRQRQPLLIELGLRREVALQQLFGALQVDAVFAARVPAFHRYSKFPSIRRDLAIVVDEHVSADAVKSAARAASGDLLQDVVVFDVYRGKGVDSRRKSIGLGLILQDVSRTLTDEDADKTMRSVMLRLENEFGATIRT